MDIKYNLNNHPMFLSHVHQFRSIYLDIMANTKWSIFNSQYNRCIIVYTSIRIDHSVFINSFIIFISSRSTLFFLTKINKQQKIDCSLDSFINNLRRYDHSNKSTNNNSIQLRRRIIFNKKLSNFKIILHEWAN